MVGSTLFLCVVLLSEVYCALTVSRIQVEQEYDVREVTTAESNEVDVEDDYGDETMEKRDIHNFTQAEKMFLKDNDETRRLTQGAPEVSKVLYHGIYPTLNVTEELGKSRTWAQQTTFSHRVKRGTKTSNWTTTSSDFNAFTSPNHDVTVIRRGFSVSTGNRTETREDTFTINGRPTKPQRPGTTPKAMRGETTRKPNRTWMTTKSKNRFKRFVLIDAKNGTTGSDNSLQAELDTRASYVRAEHPPNGFRDVDFYTNRQHAREDVNASPKYRTMYIPQRTNWTTEYKGDPTNKGHVKLVSAAYYSVNESGVALRSYYNRPASRKKRDTWCSWLDNMFEKLGLFKKYSSPEKLPRSEPLRTEHDTVNEIEQNLYGYSSNGHGHHDEDFPSEPTAEVLMSFEPATENFDELKEPPVTERSGPVLIQAPQRRIICKPPKKMARGRCRTVW